MSPGLPPGPCLTKRTEKRPCTWARLAAEQNLPPRRVRTTRAPPVPWGSWSPSSSASGWLCACLIPSVTGQEKLPHGFTSENAEKQKIHSSRFSPLFLPLLLIGLRTERILPLLLQESKQFFVLLVFYRSIL